VTRLHLVPFCYISSLPERGYGPIPLGKVSTGPHPAAQSARLWGIAAVASRRRVGVSSWSFPPRALMLRLRVACAPKGYDY